jgi:hypothetical protein
MADKQVVYREDEVVAANLEVVAGQNNRARSDEVRAATAVYIELLNLAHLRITVPRDGFENVIADAERQTRDTIGRILLAALPGEVRNAFENAAGVEYPAQGFGRIHVPFDRLIEWIATGKVESSGT